MTAKEKMALLPNDEGEKLPRAKPEVALFRKGGVIELVVSVEAEEGDTSKHEESLA